MLASLEARPYLMFLLWSPMASSIAKYHRSRGGIVKAELQHLALGLVHGRKSQDISSEPADRTTIYLCVRRSPGILSLDMLLCMTGHQRDRIKVNKYDN